MSKRETRVALEFLNFHLHVSLLSYSSSRKFLRGEPKIGLGLDVEPMRRSWKRCGLH